MLAALKAALGHRLDVLGSSGSEKLRETRTELTSSAVGPRTRELASSGRRAGPQEGTQRLGTRNADSDVPGVSATYPKPPVWSLCLKPGSGVLSSAEKTEPLSQLHPPILGALLRSEVGKIQKEGRKSCGGDGRLHISNPKGHRQLSSWPSSPGATERPPPTPDALHTRYRTRHKRRQRKRRPVPG